MRGIPSALLVVPVLVVPMIGEVRAAPPEVNRLLAEEDDGERVFFREVSGLGPDSASCERWAVALEPELKRWLADE